MKGREAEKTLRIQSEGKDGKTARKDLRLFRLEHLPQGDPLAERKESQHTHTKHTHRHTQSSFA